MKITSEMIERAAHAIDPDLAGKLRWQLEQAQRLRDKPEPSEDELRTAGQHEANASNWEKDALRKARKVVEAAIAA